MLGTIAISLGITAVAAAYDIHRTLQFIGAFAVLATIGTVPVRYDNYQVLLLFPGFPLPSSSPLSFQGKVQWARCRESKPDGKVSSTAVSSLSVCPRACPQIFASILSMCNPPFSWQCPESCLVNTDNPCCKACSKM